MILGWFSYLGDLFGFMDLRCQAIRRHLYLMLAILSVGTCFYGHVEHLTAPNAAYFSVITLATVGYGDISPKTTAGRVFTTFYLVLGVAVHLSFAACMVAHKHRAGCGCPPLGAEKDDGEQEAVDEVCDLRYLADGGDRGNLVVFPTVPDRPKAG